MFYKVIENGVITSLHQSAAQPPNSEQITNEKYNELLATIRSRPEDTLASIYKLMNATERYEPFVRTHEQTVDWYYMQVMMEKMTIDDVPEEYKAGVQAKLPEKPNNEYGIDNTTYNNVIDDYTMELVEKGVL